MLVVVALATMETLVTVLVICCEVVAAGLSLELVVVGAAVVRVSVLVLDVSDAA